MGIARMTSESQDLEDDTEDIPEGNVDSDEVHGARLFPSLGNCRLPLRRFGGSHNLRGWQ